MKAAVLMRVSTEEQRDRETIRLQQEYAEGYCKLNNIDVYNYYADDGVSGTIPLSERPQGARLLADARDGKFRVVLVYKLDRLGRSPYVIMNAVEQLKGLGVEIRSMTESFRTGDPSGELLMTVLSGIAGFERSTLLQRSKEGTERLVREGAWVGGIVPYGYRVEGNSADTGKRRAGKLVISEDKLLGLGLSEADVIRLIFRMAASERKSCQRIAEHLNERDIPTAYKKDGRKVTRGKRKKATAGRWYPSRIRTVLTNPTYKGQHQYGKRSKTEDRPVIEREVLAIVDVETWDRAQRTLKDNFRFSPRNGKRDYLLRGLIKCGLCGRKYIGTGEREYKGPGTKIYYRCNGKHQRRAMLGPNGMKCGSRQIGADIEERVWQNIVEYIKNPGERLASIRHQFRTSQAHLTPLLEEIEELTEAIANLDKQRDTLFNLHRRGLIDDKRLEHELEALLHDDMELTWERAELEKQLEGRKRWKDQIIAAERALRDVKPIIDQQLTWAQKRRLVEAFVQNITLYPFETEDGRPRMMLITSFRSTSFMNFMDILSHSYDGERRHYQWAA